MIHFLRKRPTSPGKKAIMDFLSEKAHFDDLVDKTLERESISPVKYRILNLGVIKEMRK